MYNDRDLRYYDERIRRAVLIDPADHPKDLMHIGAAEVETLEGRRMTYAVVGEEDADWEQGRISWVSILARDLAEARVGEWRRGNGRRARSN